MDLIKEALTFDDVLLTPKYSEILPLDVVTNTSLSINLNLKIPILSSAMDTVTESKMAIAIAKAGGIGVIHRNLEVKNQILEIKKVKSKNLLIGAAVGAGPLEQKRAEAILNENVDLIVVDTAHGHTKKVSEIIKKIKMLKPKKTTLCAGNIATKEAAEFLIKLGVDVIKVGIGPGSICTTRLVAGIGVPQLSAILAVRKGVGKKKVSIISHLVKNNIPVVSHIGVLPQHFSNFNKIKTLGKTTKQRKEIVELAYLLEDAGSSFLLLECIDKGLAQEITKNIKIPTIGIGASKYCDGQVLVINDLLNLDSEQKKPKFVKKYTNLEKIISTAVKKFTTDVLKRRYPSKKYSYF